MSLTLVLAWLAAIALLLAIHPFITYPLSLAALNVFKRRQMSTQSAPAAGRFAICMCAYNEQQVIVEKINNLLALCQNNPGVEVLIYVDAASDRTVELLTPFAGQFKLHVSPQRFGKTHGMNLLMSQTDADLVIFTDANVMLSLDVITRLRHHFSDQRVGCVCGNLVYTNSDDSVTAATGSLYWRLEQTIKSLEQTSGSVMGADGSLFAIRRALHHPPPDHIIDDMYVSLRIMCDGFRVIQAADVRAFEKSATVAREEFSRKIRIACQGFNVHKLLWPLLKQQSPLTLYKYVSHKLLRWLAIYFIALSVVLGEAALLLAHQSLLAALLIILMAVGCWAGMRLRITPLTQIVDVLLSLVGAGLGVWKSLRGERFQTWQPANSIRKPSRG